MMEGPRAAAAMLWDLKTAIGADLDEIAGHRSQILRHEIDRGSAIPMNRTSQSHPHR